MKKTLLYILLAASLSFNMFFATGYFLAEKSMKKIYSPKDRVEFAAKKLSLDREQKKELIEIVEEARRSLEELKSERRETVELFRSELRKSSPDVELLKRAMNRIESKNRRVREEILSKWKSFYSTLSKEQKKMVKKLLKNRPDLRKTLIIPKFSDQRG